MPKIVCVQCERQYTMVESGVYVVDTFLDPPQPYKIHSGDKWQCPGCSHQIIAGFGERPLAEHYQGYKFHHLLSWVKDNDSAVWCFEK